MLRSVTCPSPVGRLTLASNGDRLLGLWLEGQRHFGGGVRGEMASATAGGCPVLARTRDWLERYFAGLRPDADELPLAPEGSEFQLEVWRLLREIPYGETASYGGIARKMAGKVNRPGMSARAVGGAVGRNPIAIIIPCHRVLGADGSLTGYAGGLDRKITLLRLEGVACRETVGRGERGRGRGRRCRAAARRE